VLAYDEGLEGGDTVLASAVWRNLYTMDEKVGIDQLAKMVEYIRCNCHEVFEQVSDEELMNGQVHFILPHDKINDTQVKLDITQQVNE
jgi:hypothetical protein